MTIRAAILGYGRNGSTMHAGGVENNPHMTMAAVCDIDPERRAQAAARFACPVYDDYRDMLDREELDLVCVVTRSDQHCPMVCDCLDAGVDVLVTKPWALNEGEALTMIEKAAETGRRLLPWLPARWGADLKRLRRLVVDEEVIGNVFLARRCVCSFATRCDWQTERQYGGGYLLNWGMHIIDPPVLLLGGKVESVYARMKQTINPGDTEDLFFAVMTLDTGAIVHVEHTISAEPLPSWVIQGDRGTIIVHDRAMRIHRSVPPRPGDPTRFTSMAPTDKSITEEVIEGEIYGDTDEIYTEIAAALLDERPYPVTPDDALHGSRLLDAIRLSAQENRVVVLS